MENIKCGQHFVPFFAGLDELCYTKAFQTYVLTFVQTYGCDDIFLMHELRIRALRKVFKQAVEFLSIQSFFVSFIKVFVFT